MTQKLTHKERAEEFILRLGITGAIRIAGEVSLLTEAFTQIANEALEEAENVAGVNAKNFERLYHENRNDYYIGLLQGARNIIEALRALKKEQVKS